MSHRDPHSKSFAVVDLFSGPGGLSLGFDLAGLSVAIGVELDSNAARTYKANFPHAMVIEESIQDIDGSDILRFLNSEYPDRAGTVVVGGPPCQPFSGANRQRNGMNHPSASAVEHYWRLLGEIRPDAFLFENVVTFESMGGGKSFLSLLHAMKEVGFSPSIAKLRAEDFGVPQHRRRLFIGGISGVPDLNLSDGEFARTNDCRHQHNGTYSPSVKDAISDLPRLPRGGGGNEIDDYSDQEETLCRYQEYARSGSRRLLNHWSSKHGEEVMHTLRYIKCGRSLVESWDVLPDRSKRRYTNKASIHGNIYRRLSWKSLSPTIVHPRRAMLIHPKQNRILSVREAARIQGFPDRFKFCGGLDSQYQQVANAVPPPLAKYLGEHYMSHLLKIHDSQ